MDKYIDYKNTRFETMLYRYAVMLKLLEFNTSDIEIYNFIDKSRINAISSSSYSEQKERLVFLYATGTLTDSSFDFLFDCPSNFLSDIIMAEQLLLSEEKKRSEKKYNEDNDEIVSTESSDGSNCYIGKALILCAVSNYKGFIPLDFISSLSAVKSENFDKYIDFDSEYPVCIKYSDELIGKLRTINEPLAEYYDEDENFINSDSGDHLINMHKLPFILDYADKLYGLDFIRYCSENGIASDNASDDTYKKYLNEHKLKFDITAYRRRRNICGNDRYNYIDYSIEKSYKDENGRSCIDEENSSLSEAADNMLSMKIQLDVYSISSEADTDSLLKKTLHEYEKRALGIADNTVIQVMHENKIYFYVYINTEFKQIEDFNKELFNFRKVWQFVCEQSAKGAIIRKNQNIEFTVNDNGEYALTSDELFYAKQLAQYQIESKKSTNKIFASLAKGINQRIENAKKKLSEDKGNTPPKSTNTKLD